MLSPQKGRTYIAIPLNRAHVNIRHVLENWYFGQRSRPLTSLDQSLPRSYPEGFGVRLLQLYRQVKDMPRLSMRQKKHVETRSTDLEIFMGLPLGDPWVDAKLPSLFLYLMNHEQLRIPPGWQMVMEEMHTEMKKYATSQHMFSIRPI